MPGLIRGGAFSFRLARRGLLFATLYFAAMVSAVALTRYGSNVSPIWIASAVLAWALITAPPEDWPLLVGMCASAHVLAGFLIQDSPPIEAVFLVANMTSPLLFAALMRWRGDTLDFQDRGNVLRFLIYGVLAPVSSTAIVAAAAWLDPHDFNQQDSFVWFLSDSLSFIVFLPVIRAVAGGDLQALLAPRVRARAAMMFAVLVALQIVAYMAPSGIRRVVLTVLVPYMVFIAFELGTSGARGAIFISTLLLVGNILLAPVSPLRDEPPQEYVVTVQIWLAAVCACILPLSAALAEKQKLYEAASNALSDAQAAWGELIAAEAHYRLIADNATELILRTDLRGGILFASPAFDRLSPDAGNHDGRLLPDLAHPNDGARVHADLATFLAEGSLDRPNMMRLRLRDAGGEWRDFEARATLVAPGGRQPEEFIIVLRPAAA